MSELNFDDYKFVTAIGISLALFYILIRNILARERDRINSNRERKLTLLNFLNTTISMFNNYEINSSDTISSSIEKGEPFIIDVQRIISKKNSIILNELWEKYKYETYYNQSASNLTGEFVCVGTSDGERREKAIDFLHQIASHIK